MHIHVFSPILWIAFAFFVVALRHRRRMAEMGLREGSWRDSLRDRFPGHRFQRGPVKTGHESEELAQLRERVKVLERIATEAESTKGRQSARLAAEIEALRD